MMAYLRWRDVEVGHVGAVRAGMRSIVADSLLGGYRKRGLRRAIARLPIDDNYPFDVELRLLAATDLVTGPMLDVGANTGVYSAGLERRVGAGNLYLFEPLPELATRLRRRFPRSHVLNVACSDHEGTATIHVPVIDGRAFDTRATLNHHLEERQTGQRTYEVTLTTLDSAVQRLGLQRMGFLKIDVEGHELSVLRGAEQVLADLRPLVLMEAEARHHGFPLSRIFDEVLRHGYRGYFIRIDPLGLEGVDRLDTDRDQDIRHHQARQFLKYLNNFFFVPVEREAAFVQTATSFLRHSPTAR